MAAASSAHAKATAVSPYTLPQTFGAALRLLRVDLGLEVTERDAEAAYLLFQYRSNDEAKHPVEGAVELIALENEVRVVIKIPALPEAHERLLRDRLVKKLREDFGEPPKRKPAAKPADPAKPAEPNKPHPAPPNEDEKPAP
jgi:transaldolase